MEVLRKIIKNYYLVVSLFFMLWLTFFDSNDIYSQYNLVTRINTLDADKAYYLEKVKEVRREQEKLLNNMELLEKFAREEYLMKKKSEDLYIVVQEEEN